MFARNRQKHAEETANKHQRNVQETHLTTSRTIRAKVASFAKIEQLPGKETGSKDEENLSLTEFKTGESTGGLWTILERFCDS